MVGGSRVEGPSMWKELASGQKRAQVWARTLQRAVSTIIWLNQSIYKESSWSKAEKSPECPTEEFELYSGEHLGTMEGLFIGKWCNRDAVQKDWASHPGAGEAVPRGMKRRQMSDVSWRKSQQLMATYWRENCKSMITSFCFYASVTQKRPVWC